MRRPLTRPAAGRDVRDSIVADDPSPGSCAGMLPDVACLASKIRPEEHAWPPLPTPIPHRAYRPRLAAYVSTEQMVFESVIRPDLIMPITLSMPILTTVIFSSSSGLLGAGSSPVAT